MILLLGGIVVLASVLAGFVMHGGNMMALFQPSEFLIIGGAAIGQLVIGTPVRVLKDLASQLGRATKPPATKDDYLDLLTMLYNLFRLAQQSGVMALENHAEKPKESSVLSTHPRFMARHGAPEFLCDSLKVMIMGGVTAHDFETLMEEDLEVHHHMALQPAAALARTGDALPGLGIVAAVLGVVITMAAIDGPPAEIGEKVAAALVGTFLGILLAYGFVSPLAVALECQVADAGRYLECVKTGLLAVHKGLPPAIAVEFARRVLPDECRPSFDETERACRGARATQAPSAAAAA
jgi:chemotaxis protein MotA